MSKLLTKRFSRISTCHTFFLNICLRHNIYFSMRNKADRLYEMLVIITNFKFGNHKEANIHRKNTKYSDMLCEGAVKNGVQIQGTLGPIHLNKKHRAMDKNQNSDIIH